MNENEWTEKICNRLKTNLENLHVDVLQGIPYSHEILEYLPEGKKWLPLNDTTSILPFETDMVVYEMNDFKRKPRVIIEAKIKNVTTHDAITYSYKAEKHKTITPYLRYGIMLGGRENHPLSGRLFRHGANFDFMFSFSGYDPSNEEWDSFVKLIKKEVEYSIQLEEMLNDTRKKDRKHYYILQKQLFMK